ncbi:MAG TPA: threonine/serine exporter family protein [Nakamurella sp.]
MPTQPDDDELLLIRQSGVVLRAGLMSLSAGTGSYRVKETMARIAAALGIDRHHAQVTLTEITSTSHRGHSFRTEVAEVATVGVNASRLAALETLSVDVERLERPADVADVAAALDRIEREPPRFGLLLNGLWAGLACAAFCFLIGGGPFEVVGALLGGWVGQMVRRALLGRHYNHFGVTMLAGAAACLVFLGFVESLRLVDEPVAAHQAGYVAAVLFLIPGFPLVTAGLDLAKLDLSAGVARLTYAVLIAMSAALAVWAAAIAFDLTPGALPTPKLGPAVLIPLQAVASFVGVAGFALMFNGTWRMALAAGVIGMVANVLRLELVRLDLPPQAAAALAALLVGLLTAVAGPRLRVPRITLSVPAVLVMVPGVLLYRAVYAVSQGDAADAVGTFAQAALVTVALPIGLTLARMLTDRRWAFAR